MLQENEKVEETKTEGAAESAPLTEEEQAEKRAAAKKAVLDAIKKDVIDKSGMSEEDAQLAIEMLDEADMPIAITDEEFKLGKRELDIRNLSDANYKQIVFRTLITQGVWLRNVVHELTDVIRLMYVVLDAMGVKNLLKTEDSVIAKLTRERNELVREQILKQSKKN